MQQELILIQHCHNSVNIVDIITSCRFINLIEFWIKSNTTNFSTCKVIYVCIQIPNHDPNAMQSRVCCQGKLTPSET